MTEPAGSGGLHIDSDWKSEAAREKERLAAEERATAGKGGPAPQADFIELVNLLAMQAVISLGGYQGPGGERIPPNPLAAKHQIDLLEVLEKRTSGNLTDEEKRTLDAVLYELRMQYVHLMGGARSAAKKA
ncbi:MAG: DUF1844 domain-containing protein [Planctomycetota bacterium]